MKPSDLRVLEDLEINPSKRNSAYSQSVSLSEIVTGLAVLTINKDTQEAWISTFSSGWRVEENCYSLSIPYEDLSKPCIVADGSKGEVINLSTIGICRGPTGWSTDCFSVVITRRNVRELDFWLRKKGLYRASDNVRKLAPAYFSASERN